MVGMVRNSPKAPKNTQFKSKKKQSKQSLFPVLDKTIKNKTTQKLGSTLLIAVIISVIIMVGIFILEQVGMPSILPFQFPGLTIGENAIVFVIIFIIIAWIIIYLIWRIRK